MEHPTTVESYCSIITELCDLIDNLDRKDRSSNEINAICDQVMSKLDYLIIDNKLEKDCPAVSFVLRCYF